MTTPEEATTIRYINPEGIALVRIDPAGDPRVHALGLEVTELVQRAEACMVVSDADVRVATEDLAFIKGLMEAFEAKRKEYVAPLSGFVKDINAAFKEFTVPLEQADQLTRGKVLAYRQEQERQRAEQERINRLREEAAQAEMKLKGELSEPVGLVEVAPAPPAHVRTPMGMMGVVKTWQWEVKDFAALPDMYNVPDAAKIKKVVQAGGTIPGVRVWQEEGLRISPRR